MTESNELVVIEQVNIPALFQKDGCDPILEGLKKEAAEFEGDISTAKGRKEIASFARKFSTSKAYLGKLGKALSDEYRAKIAPINVERNKIETCCDELRVQVRKPLTDWENAEKKRVTDIETRIKDIENTVEQIYIDAMVVEGGITSGILSAELDKLKVVVIDESFEEFELAAKKAKEAALTQLEAKFIVLQNAEKEKAEAERLEKERLEKEQKEREEKIAEEAAEAARIEAEEKAHEEAEEKEMKEKEEREKLEKEKLQLQLDKEKAERETKEAEEKAEREKKEAEEAAERDREAAVKDEKKRQADQIKADKEAEEKRQANKRHRGKINREAKASFVTEGYTEKAAEEFIKLIVQGKIANITINY